MPRQSLCRAIQKQPEDREQSVQPYGKIGITCTDGSKLVALGPTCVVLIRRGSMPLINSIFGLHTWVAFWGPVVSLGALLLLMRLAMTRRVEREFAVGYAAFVVFTVVVSRLALTSVWGYWAGTILKL